MIIVMRRRASAAAIERVIATIRECGLNEHLSEGLERTIIGVLGDERRFDDARFAALPEVERAVRILHDWQIVSREAQAEDTVISVRGIGFGGQHTVRIAAIAQGSASEHHPLPAWAQAVFIDPFFTPARPYEALNSTSEKENASRSGQVMTVHHIQNIPVIVRIRDTRQIEPMLSADADMLYLGGELLNNATLAREVGRLNTPLILCKDKHHSPDDWLRAAERVALYGNHQIMLGEAGTLNLHSAIATRLDCEAIAIARALSHLPLLADLTRLVNPYQNTDMLATLATAAGAHTLICPADK